MVERPRQQRDNAGAHCLSIDDTDRDADPACIKSLSDDKRSPLNRDMLQIIELKRCSGLKKVKHARRNVDLKKSKMSVGQCTLQADLKKSKMPVGGRPVMV